MTHSSEPALGATEKLKERALQKIAEYDNLTRLYREKSGQLAPGYDGDAQLLRDLVREIERLEKWRSKGQAFLRYYRKNNFDGCEALIDELDLLEQAEARAALSGGSHD